MVKNYQLMNGLRCIRGRFYHLIGDKNNEGRYSYSDVDPIAEADRNIEYPISNVRTFSDGEWG